MRHIKELVDSLTIHTSVEDARRLFREINELALVDRAEFTPEVRRRLDLTDDEYFSYAENPSSFNGVIHRCDPYLREGWLKTYLQFTEGHEAPEEFHFWVAVSVLSGALRRNVFFSKDYYQVFPNHYIVLVAPAGRCRKSTSISIGVSFLNQIESVRVIAEKITPEALSAALMRPKNVGTRVLTEATGYISAPELTVFLGKQQYNEGLIILLTRLYDNQDFDYETRTKAPIHLKNVALSLIGGTTPDWLADAIPQIAFGGGFMSRIIFIVKNDTPRIFPRPRVLQPELKDLLSIKLLETSEKKAQFIMTEACEKWYDRWYEINRQLASQQDQRMSYYLERKPDHLIRLSLVMAMSEGVTEFLTEDLMERSLGLLNSVEKVMPDAFAEVEATTKGRHNVRILNQIRKRGGTISHKDLAYLNWRYGIKSEIYEITDTLEDAGLINITIAGRGGRTYTLTEKGRKND